MKKTLRKRCNTHRFLTKNHSIPLGLKLSPLIHSIRKLIALGGLTIASAGVSAEAQINPHEIWLNPGKLQALCAQDIDQDGDMDLFKIFPGVVSMLENIGTPESPEFAPPLPFANDTGSLKLNRLGLSDCRYYHGSNSVSIDIDADGDLDLFTASPDKAFGGGGGGLEYAQNNGTTEHPLYVIENNHDLFGLPNISGNFFFRDIDNDGDEDFFHNSPTTFYENIGTPENAQFIDRMEHPLQPFCNDDLEFLVDLNNDNQWDAICHNFQNNTFELIESSVSGYLPARNLFNPNLATSLNDVQAIDVDKDGDMDIISTGNSELVVYTNIGSSLEPQFDNGNSYPNTPAGLSTFYQIFSDLDGDGDLDYISHNSDRDSRLIYANNKGSNISTAFEVSPLSPELIQCNNSFYEIADANRTNLNNVSHFSIKSIALVDIDGDNDLDLFSQLKLSETNVTPGPNVTVYCENKGSVTNPLFSSGLINPFGLKPESRGDGQISFGDIDGDNDQDVWIGSRFFDNIGDSNEALFRHISHLAFSSNSSLVDIDGDGQIDSVLEHSGPRLLYKGLEPATNIAAIALQHHFVLATSRASQIQLQLCNPLRYLCEKTLVLPSAAQELSLSTGDFNGNGHQDIVLAMVDTDGNLKIELFDLNLQLIGSATGGSAHSISVSAGQLDDDLADEYVVSFVQPDNRVAAITFNLDGSQVGKAETNPGKQPSVAVGKLDGKNDAYVLAYTTLENNLQTSVHKGDGTQLSQTFGELSSQVFVSTADISPSKPGDEYVVAMVRASGLAGLNGFAADSTFLGEVTGDIAEQPKVVSGHFSSQNDSGLAVSFIQQDNKPALTFLDNQGRHLATAVGGTTASFSTHVLFDIDGDGIDEGILVYIDDAGIPRWEVFGAEGVKK